MISLTFMTRHSIRLHTKYLMDSAMVSQSTLIYMYAENISFCSAKTSPTSEQN